MKPGLCIHNKGCSADLQHCQSAWTILCKPQHATAFRPLKPGKLDFYALWTGHWTLNYRTLISCGVLVKASRDSKKVSALTRDKFLFHKDWPSDVFTPKPGISHRCWNEAFAPQNMRERLHRPEKKKKRVTGGIYWPGCTRTTAARWDLERFECCILLRDEAPCLAQFIRRQSRKAATTGQCRGLGSISQGRDILLGVWRRNESNRAKRACSRMNVHCMWRVSWSGEGLRCLWRGVQPTARQPFATTQLRSKDCLVWSRRQAISTPAVHSTQYCIGQKVHRTDGRCYCLQRRDLQKTASETGKRGTSAPSGSSVNRPATRVQFSASAWRPAHTPKNGGRALAAAPHPKQRHNTSDMAQSVP